MSSPRRRARENLTGIVSVLVTGIWMAALFLDFDWWLGFMLFGYIVLVPVTALLFGDESDVAEWWDDDVEGIEEETEASHSEEDDALQELRSRYARGELTDEQFERKLERLLETETLADVEEEANRSRETELDRE